MLAPPTLQEFAAAVRRTGLVHDDRRRDFRRSQGRRQRPERLAQQRQSVEGIDDRRQFDRGIDNGRRGVGRDHGCRHLYHNPAVGTAGKS